MITEKETLLDKALAVMNHLEERIRLALVSEERLTEMLATLAFL